MIGLQVRFLWLVGAKFPASRYSWILWFCRKSDFILLDVSKYGGIIFRQCNRFCVAPGVVMNSAILSISEYVINGDVSDFAVPYAYQVSFAIIFLKRKGETLFRVSAFFVFHPAWKPAHFLLIVSWEIRTHRRQARMPCGVRHLWTSWSGLFWLFTVSSIAAPGQEARRNVFLRVCAEKQKQHLTFTKGEGLVADVFKKAAYWPAFWRVRQPSDTTAIRRPGSAD